MKKRPYKITEERFIRDNYGKLSVVAIAKHLGRTKSSVSGHISVMGLKLPDDIRRERIALGTFKPGQKPHNAGTKGKMKPNATSFKKGQLPHNTKFDGAVSVRKGYKYVRVAQSKWELLHRHLWISAHGPIPAGMIVVFRDGNAMNCELANLELITRQEGITRNRNREKASETYKRRTPVRQTMRKLRKEFPNLFN